MAAGGQRAVAWQVAPGGRDSLPACLCGHEGAGASYTEPGKKQLAQIMPGFSETEIQLLFPTGVEMNCSFGGVREI